MGFFKETASGSSVKLLGCGIERILGLQAEVNTSKSLLCSTEIT